MAASEPLQRAWWAGWRWGWLLGWFSMAALVAIALGGR